MSSTLDKDSVQCWGNVLGNAQSMPRINGAIGKHNVSSIDLSTSIVGIAGFDSFKCFSRGDIECKSTHLRERGERDEVTKWLVGGVCRLEVAKFGACLIIPLST